MEDIQSREICYKCYRPKTSCVCEYITPISTKAKFVILMHPKEYRKTKNGTGHMTNNTLTNSEVIIGINFTEHKRINELLNDETYEPYLLYPSDDSIKINQDKIPGSKPPMIFILDSSWPCSRKMLRESKNLQYLKKISFENNKPSSFKIKTQPSKYCLSTIESTLEVLKELNNQNLESVNLSNFLLPFEKMVSYQEMQTENKNIRYKPSYKK